MTRENADSDAGDAPDDPDAPAADLRDLPAFADGRNHSLPGEPEWPVKEVVVEYDEGWFVGGYDRVEQPDGTEKNYYWAELSPATVIVAVADDRVLFVEQYRPTVRNTQLELPAGIVESGESYTEAGARELAEETGFEPSSTSLLQEVWCSTGVLRHTRGYVFAEGLEPVDVDHDSNEFLAPRSVPVEEALEIARDPPTNDATLEGLLLAEREGLL
ncbi:NUDIX hydrolase [Halorubrum distributum JCM 9100]|uniref:NUDIX hydrolase n=2 Tax=Halorubrum distributum TaxID=29283 RepID=M0EEZ8_9EURY|nr:NUDIX hydrolase [Halorubrum distributum]ELZ45462.1 NUDIX hydrolase [Halorubrum distributum JCM 9100]ELZ50534.1 NUDIX hydrolase [Halorubrum distributum JCM 10118]